MKIVLIMALGIAAMPLALEQLAHLQIVAERWTRHTFLSGIVTAHANKKQSNPSH